MGLTEELLHLAAGIDKVRKRIGDSGAKLPLQQKQGLRVAHP